MGRPSIYDVEIKPRLQEIQAAVENGATVEEIAELLGIAVSTIYKYKREKKEFSEAFARGRAHIIISLKTALLRKALGFEYEEKKQYITEGEDGSRRKHTEIIQRYSPPSETAAAMLLRNYSSEWIDRDSVTVELKKQEMELRRAIAESNNFDLDIGGAK